MRCASARRLVRDWRLEVGGVKRRGRGIWYRTSREGRIFQYPRFAKKERIYVCFRSLFMAKGWEWFKG